MSNRSLTVLVTGATGFIGRHVVNALLSRGHRVRAIARHVGSRPERERLEWKAADLASGPPSQWDALLEGVDAVVNTAGIIREMPGNDFVSVHERGPIALFDACARAAVAKVVQISAMGADDQAETPFLLTKRAADRHLASLGVPYVVLRPSFVHGPGDHSMTFFKAMAAQPVVAIAGDGRYRVQPLHVDDLCRAVVQAVEDPGLSGLCVDIGGAETLTFEEMLVALRRWLGLKDPLLWHIPLPLVRLVARVTDALGFGPITTDELKMLSRGAASDNGPFTRAFGSTPRPFSVALDEQPCTEKDRLHARTWLVRPLLRATVGFIWLATAFISAFVHPVESSYAMLEQAGISGALAPVTLYGLCLLEAVLGLVTLLGFRMKWVVLAQLLLIAGFTLVLSLTMPELWTHPFGPLTKNVPLVGATLAMLALER